MKLTIEAILWIFVCSVATFFAAPMFSMSLLWWRAVINIINGGY